MKQLLLALCLICLNTNSLQAQQAKTHINHTAIYVIDLQKSLEFYSKIIGLDSIPNPFNDNKHAWYNTGEHVMLHVIQGATEKKEYYKNQHTCYTVPNFNAFIGKLKAANWSWEDVSGRKNAVTTRVDGVHQIWLQDPDGYWLEINDDKY